MESPSTILLLNSPLALIGRLQALFTRLHAINATLAKQLLGLLCENPAAKISVNSVDEVWVTAAGHSIRVGDMAPEHVAHCLALILRNARAGKYWRMRDDGMLSSGSVSEFNTNRKRARYESKIRPWMGPTRPRDFAAAYNTSEYV